MEEIKCVKNFIKTGMHMAGNWTFIISSLFALCTNIITVFESNSEENDISDIFPDLEK